MGNEQLATLRNGDRNKRMSIMKKIKVFTTLLLLIFPMAVFSQQITVENNNLKPNRSMELEILDKNEQPVIDAQLSVNGFTAVYNTERGKYDLRYKDERTYHLKISHPDYLPVNCEGLRSFPSRLYLLKEGEYYHFESGLKYLIASDSLLNSANSFKILWERSKAKGIKLSVSFVA